jgi:crotonobetainyl-CoA:carnitine CoA-transferase CaiB-like acyl-CoA transferase
VTGPLHGIRIVDLSAVLMGPYGTQTLGDMGADVIKVESLEGDLVRQIQPARNPGMGHVFLNTNRSKRSLAMDLKSPQGREALLRLVKDADVLVYNMRPQAMGRLGLTYEEVARINPKIIYIGVFGYGENGPYAGRPAYDDLIQGAVGLPSLILQAGAATPRYVPCAISDRIVGLIAANAVCGALVHRERTGKGQKIDMPMFETMATFVLNDHLGGTTFDPPIGPAGYVRLLSKERRPYRTKDGFICAMIYNDKHWANFTKAMGQEAPFTADPRFATFGSRIKHTDEVLGKISELFLTRTSAEWIKLLDDNDIPVMPLHNLDTIFEDEHLKAVGFFGVEDHPTEGKLRRMPAAGTWSETQAAAWRHAPRLGEQSVEILKEAGFSQTEIDEMIAKKIVAVSAPGSGAAKAEV